MGKAGQIALNIATTFSSTGTPSVYLHPSEAQHGDLGILQSNDVLILLSNSGKTREILELNGDSSHFNSYSDTTLKYILYSNVFNYPDSLIDKIANTPAIYYQEKGSVYIGIYTIAK